MRERSLLSYCCLLKKPGSYCENIFDDRPRAGVRRYNRLDGSYSLFVAETPSVLGVELGSPVMDFSHTREHFAYTIRPPRL